MKYGSREQALRHKYHHYESYRKGSFIAGGGELAGGEWGVATHKLFWCAIIFALWNEPHVVHLAYRNIHTVIFKLLQDITTEYV